MLAPFLGFGVAAGRHSLARSRSYAAPQTRRPREADLPPQCQQPRPFAALPLPASFLLPDIVFAPLLRLRSRAKLDHVTVCCVRPRAIHCLECCQGEG
eukprot:2252084-Rhodomonas_salina.2